MAVRKQLGLFGGTFNPVHRGHVQSARELKQLLQLDELRLLPCHQPPHRDTPDVSSEQRLAMVALAIRDEPGLEVDNRELERDGPSYTIDTLVSLRQELGDEVSLYWVMGADAFAGLASWHRWQELLDHAHIVVMDRPDAHIPDRGEVADLLAERRVLNPDLLREQAAGHILLVSLTAYPISATDIRQRLACGETATQLLPSAVANYIEQHQLYR